MDNQQQPTSQPPEPSSDASIKKAERKPVFKVVPLVDDFAPGVDPDNLKDILNDMDVAAYLEQDGMRELAQDRRRGTQSVGI